MSESAVEGFIRRTMESVASGAFVRLVLSREISGEKVTRTTGRLIELRGQFHLSLSERRGTQEFTENIPVQQIHAWLAGKLGSVYSNALLNTTAADWQFFQDQKRASPRLVRHRPTYPQAPARTHDQIKPNILDQSAADWLRGLEVFDSAGKLRPSASDKFRQINHYLEIVSHLAEECGWVSGFAQELTIADMGCGKGYLTFGLWHLLDRLRKIRVKILGVEARAELVEKTNQLAQQIGAANLAFLQGDIASAPLPRLDALIALHACDTATDDALLRGIDSQSKLILVAPCCQHELRPQLGKPEPLAPVLAYGLMQQRMAEWLTDGLRALFLEWAGYETRMIEFVPSEHTPKNLMISAVKKAPSFACGNTRDQIVALKTFFGVESHALDTLLERVPSVTA